MPRPSLEPDLARLFAINISVSLGQTMMTSLFALFLQSKGANMLEVGIVVFSSGVASAALMVPSGILSDRLGRSRMILFSVIIAAVSPFLYTLTVNWQQLIPLSMLFSASFAIFLPARMAFIAEHSLPTNRATVYSVMNMAWSVGSIVGPVVGGFLADLYGWNFPFYLVSVISALCLVPSLQLREAKSDPRRLEEENDSTHGVRHGSVYPIVLLFSMHVAMQMGISVVETAIPIYLNKRFEVSVTQVGLFFSLGTGIATLLAQVPSGILSDRYGYRKVILSCTLIVPILYFASSLATSYLSLAGLYTLINGFWSMTWPSSIALLMNIVDTNRRGIAIGFRQTSIRLGYTVGSLLAGYLWEFYTPTVPFYVSASLWALCVPIVFLIREGRR